MITLGVGQGGNGWVRKEGSRSVRGGRDRWHRGGFAIIGVRQRAGWRDAGIFVAMVVAVMGVAGLPNLAYLDYGFGLLIVYALGALTVNVVYHYLGEINLSAITGLAVGGYCYAIAVSHGIPAAGSFVLAVVGSGIFGCLIGLPNLRLHGLEIALVTLAAAWALPELIGATGSVTGGHSGMVVASTFSMVGLTVSSGSWSFVVCSGVLLIVVGVMLMVGLRGAFGRRLLLLSGAEPASQSFGMRVGIWRVALWGVTGSIAGVAGCLYAVSTGFVGPTEFPFQTSLLVMAGGIVGGAGWLGGAVVAGVLIGLLPDLLSSLSGGSEYVLLGVLIVVAIGLGRGGLLGMVNEGVDWLRGARTHRPPVGQASDGRARTGKNTDGAHSARGEAVLVGPEVAAGPKGTASELLVVDRVSLRFGGIHALRDASLTVDKGEWLALAGPNGSGKSSLLNCISGAYIATEGQIRLGGIDVTGRSASWRGRLGVARTFQTPRLADGLSIAENVWLGCATTSVVAGVSGRKDSTWNAVYAALEAWGIEGYADTLPANVPYGVRKQAEMARLSLKGATGLSRLFLMDEPAAGLSPQEREELVGSLVRLRSELPEVTAIIVEHDIQLLRQLSDSVVVLESGQKIAEGKCEDVFKSDAVVMSFIGKATADESD